MSASEKAKEAQIYLEQGNSFLRSRQASNAVPSFWVANELKPHDAKILYGLGFAQQHAGLLTDALTNLTTSASLDPSEPKIYWSIGYAYHKLENDDKALVFLYKSVMSNPKNIRSPMLMAEIYFKRKNYTNAKIYLNQFDSRLALLKIGDLPDEEKAAVNGFQEKEAVFRRIMGK